MSSVDIQPSATARQQFSYYPQHSRKNSTRQSTTQQNESPSTQISSTSQRHSSTGSPAPSVPPRSSSHQQSATTATNSTTTTTAAATSPSNPSRQVPAKIHHEESTVIDRLIVSDPAEDEGRVQARTAQAQHTSPKAIQLSEPSSKPPAKSSSGRRKDVKFGEYILGQTIGEGEFGKVKMGWKRDSSAEVAIKLLRKEVLGANPSRLPKIYREIKILEGLRHPYIVQLHEKVETERHIGIILEYASGGELFDYILQHRYLKDNAARRLFAQLVSGVGYLHKKGIVHRDLKLENLLLDRDKNIIITDFGFANTFDPNDELGLENEKRLNDKDFVKRSGLDHIDMNGHRRGDLMQTSCGSPCYAAPELVVSDSLYTGCKVDVWSCGVILYAMLAGYLPFDDDPANPEGDNINLLYKYIVSTPLMFPEYVTPHSKDLLKRILVPNPRNRADLFEVARHSWLSEYSHIVGFITSSTTSPSDIANTTLPNDRISDAPTLARSASVREPTTKSPNSRSTVVVGGLIQKPGHIDTSEADKNKARDTKRRTVQVEYTAPKTSTKQTKQNLTTAEEEGLQSRDNIHTPIALQSPPEPTVTSSSVATAIVNSNAVGSHPKSGRDQRSASENAMTNTNAYYNLPRPSTTSGNSSYGQPAIGLVKDQAQGRFSQPRPARYTPDNEENAASNRHSYIGSSEGSIGPKGPTIVPIPGYRRNQGHKRSSTLTGLGEKLGFVKRGTLFGSTRGSNNDGEDDGRSEKLRKKRYPPVSMSQQIPNDNEAAITGLPRQSTESSRRKSFSFRRKANTGDGLPDTPNTPLTPMTPVTPSEGKSKRGSRRFSLLPSFSRGSSNPSSKDDVPKTPVDSKPKMAFGRGESRSSSLNTADSTMPTLIDSNLDRSIPRKPVPGPGPKSAPRIVPSDTPPVKGREPYYSDNNNDDDDSDDDDQHNTPVLPHPNRHDIQKKGQKIPLNDWEVIDSRPSTTAGTSFQASGLQKKENKFNSAFESSDSGHVGSSGAARRVMAMFNFRRKGGK